jgi:hypothetical protein
MLEEALAGAIGAILAAIAFSAWRRRTVISNWWTRQRTAARQDEARDEATQLTTLREQVAERGTALGINLPVSAQGNRITFANGEVITYIPNLSVYKTAMQSGRVDPQRTHPRQPPVPLTRRNRAWLEQWLNDHPLD